MTDNVQSFDAERARRGSWSMTNRTFAPQWLAAWARSDLVLSDVMMPGMNGCELRREMMRAHSAKRYPTFQTVTICRGCSGSSSLRRSSAMCESTVRVMMNEP